MLRQQRQQEEDQSELLWSQQESPTSRPPIVSEPYSRP
jgi:hypothetical protein